VRNGSCSIEAVAPEDLEVVAGEDDVDLEEGLVAEGEAGKSSQRTKVMKRVGGKIHTTAFLFLKFKGSLLVRSGAICSEAVFRCLLEACTVADTGEVGAVDVSGVSETEREVETSLTTHKEEQVLLARPAWTQERVQASVD
jgi:hypothetical protein